MYSSFDEGESPTRAQDNDREQMRLLKRNQVPDCERLGREQLTEAEIIKALTTVNASLQRRQSQGDSQGRLLTELQERVKTDGLRSLATTARAERKRNPRATPPEVVEEILALSWTHPLWGPERLATRLAQQNMHVQEQTVYNILDKHGMRTKQDRLRRLDVQAWANPEILSKEQLAGLERVNPCYRERASTRLRPGYRLAQGVVALPADGVQAKAAITTVHTRRLHLHIIVDTYSAYAFAALHPKASAAPALTLLHNQALPFFGAHGLNVERIHTQDRRLYHRSKAHHYKVYLDLHGISHDCTPRHQGSNGFVERFIHSAQEEFFAHALWDLDHYPTQQALETAFERWVMYYNMERPHIGYPNGGRPPSAIILDYLAANQLAS